jgi:hypothetical protein
MAYKDSAAQPDPRTHACAYPTSTREPMAKATVRRAAARGARHCDARALAASVIQNHTHEMTAAA